MNIKNKECLKTHHLFLKVFYIGCGAFIVAIVCQFFDENDRFFSKEITEITLTEYGIFVGIAMIGNKKFKNVIFS